MEPKPPLEKLDAQVVDMQRRLPRQFLESLPQPKGGWFANHALEIGTRPELVRSREPRFAGSLSLGRWALLPVK